MKNILLLFIGFVILNACSNSENTARNNSEETTVLTESVNNASLTYGIDISRYQGDEIDFLSKKKDTLQFIICKATGGITYTDPDFVYNWKMISEKGFIKGAYHFYYCNDAPEKQADNYLNAVGNLATTDFAPIVDFEEGGLDKTQSVETIQKNLLTFLEYVQSKTGRKPIIYTDINTGNGYLNNPVFSKYPLWIANYIQADAPHLPSAWKGSEWKMWQKGDSYTLNSIANDLDVFNGNLEQLKAFIKAD
jgi:lysozyme